MEFALSGKNIFITGPGGTGKTMLINDIRTQLSKGDGLLGMSAMTGCAATLSGGQTLHSLLGLTPRTLTRDEIITKVKGSKYLQVWKLLKVLIIDEVSMLTSSLFENLNQVAKDLRQSTAPFGGIQLILSGDFYQLPPVRVKEFLFEADCWGECVDKVCNLTQVHRQADPEFQRFLAACRIGKVTDEHFEYSKTFGQGQGQGGTLPVRLFCRNVDVDQVNQLELMKLSKKAPIKTFEAKVTYANKLITDPFTECSLQKTLSLCKGAQVLLLKNSIKEGLVNGSQGIVEAFATTGYPIVTFQTPLGQVSKVIMDYELELFRVNDSGRRSVSATVTQLPLRLAYAITIHKSQGMTLDKVTIDLGGVFEYGQAYVALSRARKHVNLSLSNFTRRSCKAHPKVKEFYRSLKEGM